MGSSRALFSLCPYFPFILMSNRVNWNSGINLGPTCNPQIPTRSEMYRYTRSHTLASLNSSVSLSRCSSQICFFLNTCHHFVSVWKDRIFRPDTPRINILVCFDISTWSIFVNIMQLINQSYLAAINIHH